MAMKKGKVILIIIAIVLLILIALTGNFFIKFNKFVKTLQAVTIENIDITKVKDGVYNGELDLKFVSAKVNVNVKSGIIESIELLEHKHGPDPKYGAEKITEKIILSQTLEVDAVSGATGSSKVIKKAVEIALKKGL